MKREPIPAVHMEKSLLTAWVGLEVGWDRVSGDLQDGANSVSQVDGISDIAPTCWHCVGEGSTKGQWPLPAFLSERKLSPSSHLEARHFSSSLDATGACQAAAVVLELRGSESD